MGSGRQYRHRNYGRTGIRSVYERTITRSISSGKSLRLTHDFGLGDVNTFITANKHHKRDIAPRTSCQRTFKRKQETRTRTRRYCTVCVQGKQTELRGSGNTRSLSPFQTASVTSLSIARRGFDVLFNPLPSGFDLALSSA